MSFLRFLMLVLASLSFVANLHTWALSGKAPKRNEVVQSDFLYLGDSLSVGLRSNNEDFLGPVVFNSLRDHGQNIYFHAYGGSRPSDWYWREDGREAPMLVSHRFRVETFFLRASTRKENGNMKMRENISQLMRIHNPRSVIIQQGTNLLPSLRGTDGQLKQGRDLEEIDKQISAQVQRLINFINADTARLCFWIMPPHARENDIAGESEAFFRHGYSQAIQEHLRDLIRRSLQNQCLLFESVELNWLHREAYEKDPLHYGLDLSTKWGHAVSEFILKNLP